MSSSTSFTIPPKTEVLEVVRIIKRSAIQKLNKKYQNLVFSQLAQISQAATSGEWGFKSIELWVKYNNMVQKAKAQQLFLRGNKSVCGQVQEQGHLQNDNNAKE